MNILFLTMVCINDIKSHGIYTDLMREFVAHGDKPYIVTPCEKKNGQQTTFSDCDNYGLLKVRVGNLFGVGIIEKGISTVLLNHQFNRAINTCLHDVNFNLILYSTPPITLVDTIIAQKKRGQATTYLLLKDIFPQNAVDLGMMQTTGVKSLIYRYFKRKENKLYAISDHIGCMSQANVDYVLRHNPEIAPDKVEICPNSIEPQDLRLTEDQRMKIRKKYDIPLDATVFVYGGNLGKPQGIPFVIDCLKTQLDNQQAYFLIVGDGTEYGKLETFFNETKPQNMQLMKRLPKNDYDRMIAACDVGLIFLDHRFTIPNFPSRLLSYMQAGLPVLACTDPETDAGKVIVDGGFGWWCESNDVKAFNEIIEDSCDADLSAKGEKSFSRLQECYVSHNCAAIILRWLGGEDR